MSDYLALYVKNTLPKLYSRELIDIIFAQPYCRIANLVERGIAKRLTASGYLKKLVEIGVLEEQNVGREGLFLNLQLIPLLTTDDYYVQRYS